MRKEKLLSETKRRKILEYSGVNYVSGANLISVDIQPEYQEYLDFNLQTFLEYLNENYESMNSLTFLYNGQDTLGMVSESEFKYWLIENGLDEEIVDSANFYDKGYAFFRYCMDEGIDEEEIVNLIKYMIDHNINDSRDINNEMWNGFMVDYNYDESQIKDILEPAGDMINIPDLMDFLKRFGGKLVLCGGGINECLKEVEIALMALDKPYNVLTEFTY